MIVKELEEEGRPIIGGIYLSYPFHPIEKLENYAPSTWKS
jgi:hypothetical protein